MNNNKPNNSTLQQYFNSIKKFQLITAETEKILADRKNTGDSKAIDELVKANLRLVIKIAKSYTGTESSLIDLIQEGNIGLLRAAEKFDANAGCKFSTYASFWIKHYISRFIAKRSRPIRLPIRKTEMLRKISFTKEYLMKTEGKEPDNSEIAKYLNTDVNSVSEIMNSFQPVISLDAEIDNDFSIMDVTADKNNPAPDNKIINEELSNSIKAALDSLVGSEKSILIKRFGMDGNKSSTLKEIGNEMNLSAETIRQIETRALSRIREKHSHLKEYVSA
ncbi:MAG TPA: RNA polymerase sigma factor RpoD/SigA [Spirochaetota bacterium]|nr:RNA polymerase sigma factor RpoD/SigA [Spirochaetota bacterium]HOH36922.1 RNA polymerase sigma factor RpoD/SigA [Spirochaetota bacterium]HQA52049.1 RNA polymerase sigma factor RpoD/SigA [Spirochaetota bacterium]